MDNFVVSARKYRPATFESVVGQGHITSTLRNAISRGQLAHAYLFCGPRGVGKTTCARIFAKAINCLDAHGAEACNACESCRSFNEGRSFNIHELDAASNNSVDDIRNLTEQVRIPPQLGRYSVYIIDEVHMLSSAAFNAFLKTLEEPPAHAVFILATTEKHKILPTILSRCQIFDFNRIRVEDSVGYLKYIASQQGVDYDEESLNLIAQKADGGMRDALSMFDKCVSFCGPRLRFDQVAASLNVLDYDTYFRSAELIAAGDYRNLLLLFDSVLARGFSGQTFMAGLGSHLRDVLMCRDEATLPLLEVTGPLLDRYRAQAASLDVELLFTAIALLGELDGRIRAATNQRLLVELGLMKLCRAAQKKNDASQPLTLELPPLGAAASAPAAPGASAAQPATAGAPAQGSAGAVASAAASAGMPSGPVASAAGPIVPASSAPAPGAHTSPSCAPSHTADGPAVAASESTASASAPSGPVASAAGPIVPTSSAPAPCAHTSPSCAPAHTADGPAVAAPESTASAGAPSGPALPAPGASGAPSSSESSDRGFAAGAAQACCLSASDASTPSAAPAPLAPAAAAPAAATQEETPKRSASAPRTAASDARAQAARRISPISGAPISAILDGTAAPASPRHEERTEALPAAIDPDCSSKIAGVKQAFVAELQALRPRLAVVFDTMAVEGNLVRVEAPSEGLREELLRNKSELLGMLARMGGIEGAIELQVHVREQYRAPRPIKIEDKLRYMTEKNPVLTQLRKALDLEIE